MFSSIIHGFNEVIATTFLIHIDTLSMSMSHFLRTHLYSLSPNLLVLMSCLYPFIYPISNTSLVTSATPPRPLKVYNRHQCTNTGPSTDLSPMAPFSMTLILPSPANLPITMRKGTRSSYNPNPIYNFLNYHRLSSPYFPFVSTSSIYVPQTMHEALHSNGT